ncbi:MAG TPA: DMT family transporter [Cyclobacteriaceae bacterium]|nr:DMT family transporter [Cyclobacteriaceae bacterium]
MNREVAQKNSILSWILLIILSLIWGSSFILMKKGLMNFTAGQVAGIRIVSGSVILLPIALKNFSRLKRSQVLPVIGSGLLGSLIPAFLFAMAQTKINSSISGVLNALTPLFTLLVGASVFMMKFSIRMLAGVLIGFIGSVILITTGSGGNFWAVNSYGLLIVLATVLYGFNINIINSRLRDMKSADIIGFSLMFVGPAALLYLVFDAGIPEILQKEPEALYSFSAVIMLGIFGTAVAYMLFNKMIKITNPVFSSSVTYLVPIVAVMWGILDGEKLQGMHYLGVLVIILGVFIANTSRKS